MTAVNFNSYAAVSRRDRLENNLFLVLCRQDICRRCLIAVPWHYMWTPTTFFR